MSSLVPVYPSISAVIRANATGELTINGTSHPIGAESLTWLRGGVIARCALIARQVKRPVRLSVQDLDESYELAVHPDAFVQPLSPTATVEDLAASAARPIGDGRCWYCRRLQPLKNRFCEQCGTKNPHNVQTPTRET
jgi:hypothetical protein